jgi:Ca-activated chloride channel family protein
MLGLGDIEFVHRGLVHLIWPAIAVVVTLWFLESHGRDALGRFVSSIMQHRLSVRLSTEQRLARSGFILGFFVFGILGLMRPQSPGQTNTVSSGRVSADIMIVLDVSRSMLADDVAPTRLDRAKADIAEMVDSLGGHRVGLVAFAGRAAVLAPLTPDYNFFRLILDNVDTRSVSRGGTKIGTALRKAVDTFEPGPGGKLLLLITDGEDHDSYPLDAAQMALEAGVRIVAIGIGSEEGSEITLVDPDTKARTRLMDGNGAPVISRLDGTLLRELALKTEGAYVPAGTAALDMESIVRDHLEPLARDNAGVTATRTIPREHYVWFVLGALACLFIAVIIGASPKRSTLA